METNFAKPTQVSEPVATLYCIECERTVAVESDRDGMYHSDIVGGWDGEVINCTFPKGFAYSAPPADLPDDWAAQEPDDDQKAELELAELEGIGEWLGME